MTRMFLSGVEALMPRTGVRAAYRTALPGSLERGARAGRDILALHMLRTILMLARSELKSCAQRLPLRSPGWHALMGVPGESQRARRRGGPASHRMELHDA